MDNQNIKNAKQAAKEALDFQIAFEGEIARLENEKDSKITNAAYSIEYALGQLEQIRIESKAFNEKICEMIEKNKSVGPGDVGTQGNGQALEALVREHGETTQKLVDFYQDIIREMMKK